MNDVGVCYKLGKNDLGVMACVGGFCHYLYFMISSKMQRNIAKYRSM